MTALKPQPALFIPHGGGPCFFMDWTMGPPDTWEKMRAWLTALPATLPQRPSALVVISGHWEEPQFVVGAHPRPPLIFDYSGFPAHTYQLTWPVKGDPDLAETIYDQIAAAGLPTAISTERGLDHGVFVPLKIAFPAADIQVVPISLKRGLDPAEHLALGRALAPLRLNNVLIVGSGMSYHNLRALFSGVDLPDSDRFDGWLTPAMTGDSVRREAALLDWAAAPAARQAHPQAEHLLPLMVAAGAAGSDPGRRIFSDRVMGATVSAYAFGAA